jgi:hypothetical protein
VVIDKIDFYFGLRVVGKCIMGFLIDPNFIPLRTLLSSRIAFSAVTEKMGMEMVNDNVGVNISMNVVNFISQQCNSCKSIDILSMTILFAGILILRNNSIAYSNSKRIESIDDDFVVLRKNVSSFIWVVLIVFTKNIENAL